MLRHTSLPVAILVTLALASTATARIQSDTTPRIPYDTPPRIDSKIPPRNNSKIPPRIDYEKPPKLPVIKQPIDYLIAPGKGIEGSFLKSEGPRQMYLFNGPERARKLLPDGHFAGSVDGGKGPGVAVEMQRSATWIIGAGAISSGAEQIRLYDLGLKAFEWGFSHAGDDGSFPTERGGTTKKQSSLHPKSMFIEAAARSLLLLSSREMPTPALKARVDALIPKLHQSASWMANSADLTAFLARAKNTNQVMFVATGLQETAKITGDQALAMKAESIIKSVIAKQFADGTIPEAGGFDISYQTVSLELMGRYYDTLPENPWRKTVYNSLRLGTNKFLSTVQADGSLYSPESTRTVPCGERIPGRGPKGRNIDIIPLRTDFLGWLLNDETRMRPIAAKILAYGQGYAHEEECLDDTEEVKDPKVKKESKHKK